MDSASFDLRRRRWPRDQDRIVREQRIPAGRTTSCCLERGAWCDRWRWPPDSGGAPFILNLFHFELVRLFLINPSGCGDEPKRGDDAAAALALERRAWGGKTFLSAGILENRRGGPRLDFPRAPRM